MRDTVYLLWFWFKGVYVWIVWLVVFIAILSFVWLSWQDRKTLIEGHEYIEKRYYRNTELIHNPECNKCKQQTK